MKKMRFVSAGVVCLAMVCAVAMGKGPKAKPLHYVTVDIPGAVSTTIFGINSENDAVGTYDAPKGYFHGFILRKGKLTTIDGPSAVFTQLRGINEQGDAVGDYIQNPFLPGGGFHGLLVTKNGVLKTIDYPGHINTILQRIKPNGQIYGCFHDAGSDQGTLESMHGISIDPKGIMTPVDTIPGVPDGTTMNNGGSNNGDRIAGLYYNLDPNNFRPRAYEIANHTFLPFDVPGSTFTAGWDMNNGGDVVGFFGTENVDHPDPMSPEGHYHGFVKSKTDFVSVDYPGSVDTRVYTINESGNVAGSYQNADGSQHGFIATDSGKASNTAAIRAELRLPREIDTRGGVVTAMLAVIDKSIPLGKAAAPVPLCHRPGAVSAAD